MGQGVPRKPAGAPLCPVCPAWSLVGGYVLLLAHNRLTLAPMADQQGGHIVESCRTAGKLEMREVSCSTGNSGQSI